MTWKFEVVAGPFNGPTGGLAWDDSGMLFSAINEERILRYDPKSGKVSELRRYTGRTNGIAFAKDGALYGAQEGGRRIIEFVKDGSARVTATRFNGRIHNHPSDLVVDRAGRVWFTDPYNPVYAFGPQIFPALEHASILRLERDERRAWTIRRISYDTAAPRAVLLSPDEKTLYVAEGEPQSRQRELRAYPVRDDGTLAPFVLLHAFGADARGAHRGIEGMCLDRAGNIVACAGWKPSGPGPLVYVFSPSGAIVETHALPGDVPNKCAFGGDGSLYVTSGEGLLYRAQGAA